jgi:hypothetical protein
MSRGRTVPKYPRQAAVLVRLERETRRALRRQEDAAVADLLAAWGDTQARIAAVIVREYRTDFPEGAWTLAEATARGTLARIAYRVRGILALFAREGAAQLRRALNDIYWQEAARHLWMLDVLTPGSHLPVLPTRRAREAEVLNGPRDYAAKWPEAFVTWVETFDTQLAANLRMEALHEGSIADAEMEAGAAKIDGFVMPDKLRSLVTTQSLMTMDDARDDVAAANADLVMQEIWQTMEDADVCPICDEFDGKPLDEVLAEIPAHFYCRCYARLVPRDWAALLASGDADEKAAALAYDDEGLVPDAMAVRGEDGSLVATVIVEFEDWMSGRAAGIYGDSIVGRLGAGSLAR